MVLIYLILSMNLELFKKKMKKKKKKTLKMLVVTLLGPLDEKVAMVLNMVALGLPKIH
jgi:hypothetical protein